MMSTIGAHEAPLVIEALRDYVDSGQAVSYNRTEDVQALATGSASARKADRATPLDEEGIDALQGRLAAVLAGGAPIDVRADQAVANTLLAALWFRLKLEQGLDADHTPARLTARDPVARAFVAIAEAAGMAEALRASPTLAGAGWVQPSPQRRP